MANENERIRLPKVRNIGEKTEEFLSKSDKENLKKARTLIEQGFLWNKTSEGSEYWRKVCSNLDYYVYRVEREVEQ